MLSLMLQELTKTKVSQGSSSKAEMGYMKTRDFVVDAMLDFVDFNPLAIRKGKRLLDPGCGDGAFFLSALDRVLTHIEFEPSWLSHKTFLAIDLDSGWVDFCRNEVEKKLTYSGIAKNHANDLAASWVRQENFLLMDLESNFDYVVGNPPYIRKESIDKQFIDLYQQKFSTLRGRFDIYVAFFEQALTALSPSGKLSFICPDRFTKNAYGKHLRELIGTNYHLDSITNVSGPFVEDVAAYAKVFTLQAEESGKLVNMQELKQNGDVTTLHQTKIANDGTPWFLLPPDEEEVVDEVLRKSISLSEANGVHIRIGVATGADKVFVVDGDSCDVEEEALMPLVLSKHLKSASVKWDGTHVINPFEENGTLRNLDKYPRLASYFEQHKEVLAKRHVAKRSKERWYRTIDRIWSELKKKPKLLIRDIDGKVTPFFEKGEFYPHHNLYYITSDNVSLKAVGAIIASSVNQYFMQLYTLKMRGDYGRNQAQYLKQLRFPLKLSNDALRDLEKAYSANDQQKIDEASYKAFGLSEQEVRTFETRLNKTS